MNYFEIKPEVAGGFGPASIADFRTRPPHIKKFNYEFDIWLGDPILESISNFIVTDSIKSDLIDAKLSGVSFYKVEVTKSVEFEEKYPNKILPSFSWLQVLGKAGKDDFGLSISGNLVISEKVLKLLKSAGMKNYESTEYKAIHDNISQ